MLEILLQQQVLHLSLRLHLVHVCSHGFGELAANSLASDLQKLELRAHHLHHLDNQTGRLNNIQIEYE